MDMTDMLSVVVETDSPTEFNQIAGELTELKSTRGGGDVGTATAQIIDATLDPVTSDALRPGRVVEIGARFGSGFLPIFTGKVFKAEVDYTSVGNNENIGNITMTVTDVVTTLANFKFPQSVNVVDHLRYALSRPAGVKFNVDGENTTLMEHQVNIVATNSNESIWGQVLLTRDTAQAFAWVDKSNRVQVWSADQIDDTPAAELGKDKYSGIDISYGSTQIVNSVTLKNITGGGESHSETHGPYRDDTSIATWGEVNREYTVLNLTKTELRDYADSILAKAAFPQPRVKTLTIPVKDEQSLTTVHDIDVCSIVTVTMLDGTVRDLRVEAISHEIAHSDWKVEYSFQEFDSLSPPSSSHSEPSSSFIPPESIGLGMITFTAREIGSSTTFFDPAEPVDAVAGDLWIDAGNDNVVKRYDGDQWVLARDLGINEALQDASAALESANGKSTIYYQATEPSEGKRGDTWFDTDDGNKIYAHDGNGWVNAQDTDISDAAQAAEDAATAAQEAQTTADGKNKIFVRASAPTATRIDDLWIDTSNGNILKRWTGSAWEPRQDSDIANAAASASDALSQANSAMTAAEEAQATADGSIRTYYQTNPPWPNGSAQPDGVLGDLWFDLDNDIAHRWNGSEWKVIQDDAIANAIQLAQNAQTTADGKITSYYQDTKPTTGEIGDLWFDTNDKNKPYYCSSVDPLVWTTVRDETIADAQADIDYLNNTTLPNLQTDLTNAQGDINDLNNTTIPNINSDIADNTGDLSDLNNTVIPGLDSRLGDAESNVTQITDVTIPAIDTRVTGAESDLDTLHNTTLPDLNSRLDTAETDLNTLEGATIPDINSRIDDAETDIGIINDTTLPALDSRLTTAEGELNTLENTTIPGINSDIAGNENAITDLNTNKLPALDTRLDTAEGELDTLDTTTIPGINSRLDTAEGDINTLNNTTLPNLQNELDAVLPITETKISDGAVTTSKMVADSILGNRIATNTLDANRIVANSITAAKIAGGTITAGELAANSVIAEKIKSGEITTSHMTANTIDGDRIAANTLDAAKIVANSIGAGQITAGGITADELAADSVLANKIKSGEIVTAHMVAGSIDGDRITANTLNANRIVSNSITALQIDTDAVTADEVAANAIRAGHILAGEIVTSHMTADSIDGDRIAANTLHAEKIVSGSLVIGSVDGLQGELDSKETPSGAQAKADDAEQAANLHADVTDAIGGGKTYHYPLNWDKTGNGLPGSLVVETPIRFENYMTRIRFEGYNYRNTYGTEIDATVGFYAYSANRNFPQTAQTSSGDLPITIQLGYKPGATEDEDTVVLILDNPAGVWHYPKFAVAEATLGQGIPPDSYRNGWSCEITEDLSAYTITDTPTRRDLNDTHGLAQGWRTTGTTTIDGGQITTDSILAAQIAAGAIETEQLAANAVTAGKILAGEIQTNHMTANTIDGDRIAANTLHADKIVANSIGAGHISANAITASELQADAVRAAHILAGEIVTSHMTADSINGDRIAANTLSADKIIANSLTIGKVSGLQTELDAKETPAGAQTKANQAESDAVSTAASDATQKANAAESAAEQYADDEYGPTRTRVTGWTFTGTTHINGGEIQTDSIKAAQIDANQITAEHMVAGTITAGSAIIADAAIDTAQIADAAISSAKIGNAQIVTAKIGDGQITNAKISSLDAGKITAGEISAARIGAGTIDTNHLATDAITAGKIATGAITAAKVEVGFIDAFTIKSENIDTGFLNADLTLFGRMESQQMDGTYPMMTLDGNTGYMMIRQLIVDSTRDANTQSGNTPPLRVGDITKPHLRIDNNEVIAMADDSTTGILNLNAEDGRINVGQAITARADGSARIQRTNFNENNGVYMVNNTDFGVGGIVDFTVGGGSTLRLRPNNDSTTPRFYRAAAAAGLTFGVNQLRVTQHSVTNYQPIWASNFVTRSDVRDKSNEEEVTGALDDLMSLKVYDYDTVQGVAEDYDEEESVSAWDATSENQGKSRSRRARTKRTTRQRGVMAQDILKCGNPRTREIVHEDRGADNEDTSDNPALMVDLYGYISTIHAAMQELSNKVDYLSAELKKKG